MNTGLTPIKQIDFPNPLCSKDGQIKAYLSSEATKATEPWQKIRDLFLVASSNKWLLQKHIVQFSPGEKTRYSALGTVHMRFHYRTETSANQKYNYVRHQYM